MSAFLITDPQLLFIHIPKTGGTSIRKGVFRGRTQGPVFGETPNEWKGLFCFAFTRDPWSRFLSAYRDHVHGVTQVNDANTGAYRRGLTLAEFAEIALDDTIAFENPRDGFEASVRHHTLPQTHPFNCLNEADFIGRFEAIDEDFSRLARYVGLIEALPRLRVSNSPQDTALETLPPKLRAKLDTYYEADFRFLAEELPKRNKLPEKPYSDWKKIPLDVEGGTDDQNKPSPEALKELFGAYQYAAEPGLFKRHDDPLPNGPALIFHVDWRHRDGLHLGWYPMLTALAEHAQQKGLPVICYHYDKQSIRLFEKKRRDEHLHIIIGEYPCFRPNVMHTMQSYIHGYWNFDEVGVRNSSSARTKIFDRRAVHPPYATRFLTRLRSFFVDPKISNYDQPESGSIPLQNGSLVFFSQYFIRQHVYRDYMTTSQMIEASIAAKGDRLLYIKPHPLQNKEERDRLMNYHHPANGVEVVDANVHDLLAAADATISLTSSACFEGFMHRKPAVLGGQTDFGQNAITLVNPHRMADAIAETLERDWPYAQFLTWYLKHHCVDNNRAALTRVLERIYRKGYDWADPETKGFY